MGMMKDVSQLFIELFTLCVIGCVVYYDLKVKIDKKNYKKRVLRFLKFIALIWITLNVLFSLVCTILSLVGENIAYYFPITY